MLYLDLSQAASTPKQTGVERFQRGFYRNLQASHPVRPLVWDRILKSYCDVSKKEKRLLEDPFTSLKRGSKKPEATGVGFLLALLSRACAHRAGRLDSLSGEKDVFIATEHFTDGRIAEMAKPMWSATRKIAVCHDTIPLLEAREKGVHSPFENYIEAVSTFDLVVCFSRQSEACLRDALLEKGLPVPRTVVFELPVDFPGERPRISAPGKKEILFVSSLNARKNHKTLIEACEILWDENIGFELVLVGRTGKGGEDIERLVREKERTRPVRWLRYVTEEQLKQCYNHCAFTVFPSLREGFGLPVIESLWHAKPCICSNQGAVSEIAENGGCIPVDVATAEELAGAMKTLLLNPEEYHRLQEEAAGRKFSTWDDFIRNWEDVLENLLK